ncbi:hypothetical protein HW132_02210 [Brasilonema sp. CT11]|nr:hypothetical protein [Brasilonema sp. CT11]
MKNYRQKETLHLTTQQMELAVQEHNAAEYAIAAKMIRFANRKSRFITGYTSRYSGRMV